MESGSELRAGVGGAGTPVLLRRDLFGRGRSGISALKCRVPAGAFAGTGTGECGWISGDERSRRRRTSTGPMVTRGHWSRGGRIMPSRIIRWLMCCAISGGWMRRRASATWRWRSMGITTGVRARLLSSEPGRRRAPMKYIEHDTGSEWSNAVRVSVLMREGKMTEAQQKAAADDGKSHVDARTAAEACLDKAPATEVHRLAELAENELLARQNPEMKYYQGRCWQLVGKSKLLSCFCARPWPEIIARTRRCNRIRCWRACARMWSSGKL